MSIYKFLFFFACLIFFFSINKYLIKYLSKYNFLYDYPNINKSSKDHVRPVLFIGGILFFLNIIIPLTLFNIHNFEEFYLIFLIVTIFLLGFFDDVFNINYLYKFFFITFIFIIFILFEKNNYVINQIHSFYFGTFYLGKYKYFFTFFCYLLFFNIINLFDGLNGLVLSLFIFVNVYLLTYPLEAQLSFYILFSLASYISLLIFNCRGLIFLGNSGSNILSIINLILIISIYKKEYPNYFTGLKINAEIIFILFFYPSVDMVRLFVQRLLRLNNPFLGDKNHIHHILQKNYGSLNTLFFFQIIFLINILLVFTKINYLIIIFFNSLLYLAILYKKTIRAN